MDQQRDGQAFLLLWRTLLRMVRRRFFWLDQNWIEEALEDAILHKLAQDRDTAPEDKEELSVSSLYGEVCRRVGDSIRACRRRQRREHEYARRKKSGNITKNSVKKAVSAANIGVDVGNGSMMPEELECLLAQLTDRERAFVELRWQGVEDFHAYAELLGVTQSSPEEQQAAVDREWHRLEMKLRRMAARLST